MARVHVPAEVERRVRQAARHRCGYCLSPQHLVMARLEIEHILPLARGGSNDGTNLWLAWLDGIRQKNSAVWPVRATMRSPDSPGNASTSHLT
ncbi:MAG TPA: hypothetical protein DEP84_37365 [Chloroflexi bacterium]|nr:hypothetical protein [Chloroflexota bacterium]